MLRMLMTCTIHDSWEDSAHKRQGSASWSTTIRFAGFFPFYRNRALSELLNKSASLQANGSKDVTKLSVEVTWYACHSLGAIIPLHTLQTFERRQQLLHDTQGCHAQAKCIVSRQYALLADASRQHALSASNIRCQQVQKHAPRITEQGNA